jgi:tetratricopeptide (TPR) repeat protein
MNRVPLPLPVILERIHLAGDSVAPAESLRRACVWRQLVEEYQPLAKSLEWQLAGLPWTREGVFPFIDSNVPYLVNNNGRVSADAAALLFASCLEPGARCERIAVLELGAGTGLFARYFLDEFRLLCERESRDFYERLAYYVTDGSPATIEQWQEREIFQDHTGHVFPRVCDANAPAVSGAGPLRAAICNCVLDVLPSAIFRKAEQGWEQLWVRTWITDDASLLKQYTPLGFEEIRALARSAQAEDRAGLLPLVPLLEFEKDFLPIGPDTPAGLETLEGEPAGAPFAYNYGALGCLDALLELLEPDGFVLVNDYGPVRREEVAERSAAQRFGPSTAMGLNFPLLEEQLGRRGVEVLKAEGDDGRLLHARLLVRSGAPGVRAAFETRFAAAARERADAPIERARREAESGHAREALESFRAAIAQNPRDWQLIGEAAVFAATQLRDRAAGLELARAAVELNPWYSPWLWNVLGDCLLSMERPEAAHECYLQAQRIHPQDVETNLKLAHSWLLRGDPGRSLEAVARGLANDSDAMFRHTLLEKQQQAMASLSVRWNMQRATAARR